MRAVQIAVVGAGRADQATAALAERVGRLVASRGATLVCGGLGGVMEAAARGARRAGGTTIGVLPGDSRAAANPWIEHVVATGVGHGRNLAVVASGDAVIAVGGAWGTASEIALARVLGRAVIALGEGPEVSGDGVVRAASAEEAVALAFEAATARRS